MSLPIKILLADDHHILRTGLKLLLATQDDFQVVASRPWASLDPL